MGVEANHALGGLSHCLRPQVRVGSGVGLHTQRALSDGPLNLTVLLCMYRVSELMRLIAGGSRRPAIVECIVWLLRMDADANSISKLAWLISNLTMIGGGAVFAGMLNICSLYSVSSLASGVLPSSAAST